MPAAEQSMHLVAGSCSTEIYNKHTSSLSGSDETKLLSRGAGAGIAYPGQTNVDESNVLI